MEFNTMEKYVVGGLITWIFGLILLYRLLQKSSKITVKETVRVPKSSENVVLRRKDGPPDVVIVGAGVAGSALAYSLAKVNHKI